MPIAVGAATCSESGCRGVPTDGRVCLAHLDRDRLAPHVAALRATDGLLDARGVEVDMALLEAVLDAYQQPALNHVRRLGGVDFSGATFVDHASFIGYEFAGWAHFEEARFEQGGSFWGSTFVHSPIFDRAEFSGPVEFSYPEESGPGAATFTTFARRARFVGTRFMAGASFDRSIFGRSALFSEAGIRGLASFDEAQFNGRVSFAAIAAESDDPEEGGATISFQKAHFATGFDLTGSNLTGGANFRGARFDGDATLAGTRFGGWARFSDATFAADASFMDLEHSAAEFRDLAAFEATTFLGRAEFIHVRFHKLAKFERAHFAGDFTFASARFVGQARFDETTLSGRARLAFSSTRCERMLSLQGATIERASTLGPMLVLGRLALDGMVALEPLRIDVAGGLVTAVRAQFRGGFDLRSRWSTVLLEDVDLSMPSSVATALAFGDIDEEELVDADAEQGPRPRVISLRRSDVSALRLDDVDVRPCRVAGAMNLTSLRIDGTEGFADARKGWRWTSRQVIAEEHEWRAAGGAPGWYPAACRPGLEQFAFEPDPPFAVQTPAVLAGIYRSLRVGKEAARDEPGAADSYYGEMEMRRRTGKSASERVLLTMYWLVSGYGLRASRALVALAVTIVTFSLLFWSFGFDDRPTYVEVLVFTASDSASLFRTPDVDLNLLGTTLELALRLLGPVFVGLAILSMRGRIKR